MTDNMSLPVTASLHLTIFVVSTVDDRTAEINQSKSLMIKGCIHVCVCHVTALGAWLEIVICLNQQLSGNMM